MSNIHVIERRWFYNSNKVMIYSMIECEDVLDREKENQ